MKIHSFKPSIPNPTKVKNFKRFISNAKDLYNTYVDDKLFVNHKEEQILIYEVTFNGVLHTGILCTVDAQEIIDGNIIRHENTLKEKEQIMMNLIKERNAHIKPVLLTIPDDPSFFQWIDKFKPEKGLSFDYTKSETHTVYPVSDKKAVNTLLHYFNKDVTKAYIADGHHRCYSVDKLYLDDPKTYGKLLVAIFPFRDLIIKPYNRIIVFNKSLSLSDFAKLSKEYFKISEASKFEQPDSRKTMMAYQDGKWISLKWKKTYLDSMPGGAMDLFNHYILDTTAKALVKEVIYVQGDASLNSTIKQTDNAANQIAFFFPSVTFKRLKPLLDDGGLVAPKSTYFEPRMRNGLVVQKL